METPNEKGSKESRKSTHKMAAGTGSARRTGGLSDNARTPGGIGNTENSSQTSYSKNIEMQNGENGLLTSFGIKKNQLVTAIGVLAGGALLYKGAKSISGNSSKIEGKSGVKIYNRLLVKRPKAELYSYWRNLENLPDFMSHIKEVEEFDDKKSHWVAEVPGGLGTIEWDAEIIWDEKNHLLSWRSLSGSEIENSGEVRFEDAAGGKSTYVETTISYRPPAGEIGGIVAKLLNPGFKKVVENDIKEFKKIMEKGRGKR